MTAAAATTAHDEAERRARLGELEDQLANLGAIDRQLLEHVVGAAKDDGRRGRNRAAAQACEQGDIDVVTAARIAGEHAVLQERRVVVELGVDLVAQADVVLGDQLGEQRLGAALVAVGEDRVHAADLAARLRSQHGQEDLRGEWREIELRRELDERRLHAGGEASEHAIAKTDAALHDARPRLEHAVRCVTSDAPREREHLLLERQRVAAIGARSSRVPCTCDRERSVCGDEIEECREVLGGVREWNRVSLDDRGGPATWHAECERQDVGKSEVIAAWFVMGLGFDRGTRANGDEAPGGGHDKRA